MRCSIPNVLVSGSRSRNDCRTSRPLSNPAVTQKNNAPGKGSLGKMLTATASSSAAQPSSRSCDGKRLTDSTPLDNLIAIQELEERPAQQPFSRHPTLVNIIPIS